MAEENNQDFITTFIMINLIFAGGGYLFSKISHGINIPLLYLSYGILRLFSEVTSFESIASQVVNTVMLSDLKHLSLSEVKSAAIIGAAGFYVKYILLVYGIALIVYIHTRPSKNKLKRLLSPQRLIEINVNYTSCLAPIVNRNPNDTKYFDEWHPALSPFEFLIKNEILIDKSTGEILGDSMLTKTGCLVNYESDVEGCFFLIDRKRTLQLINDQLGDRLTESHTPDYIKALVMAFHAFNEERPDIGQAIFDEVSLSFLNKKEMKQVKITMKKTNKYLNENPFPTINQPIHIFLVSQFSLIDPPISTTEFIWLKAINRSLWYGLHQVGGETYWSESLALGLAIEMKVDRPELLIDSVVLSYEQCLIDAGCFS